MKSLLGNIKCDKERVGASMPTPIKFSMDSEKFSEGDFRDAFMATSSQPGLPGKWVIKMCKEKEVETITEYLNISLEHHTREQV